MDRRVRVVFSEERVDSHARCGSHVVRELSTDTIELNTIRVRRKTGCDFLS